MGCGLRREIEDMLLLSGRHDAVLQCRTSSHYPKRFAYLIVKDNDRWWTHFVSGSPMPTKAKALKSFLENWRAGKTERDFPCPAQSREELKVKLDLIRIKT